MNADRVFSVNVSLDIEVHASSAAEAQAIVARRIGYHRFDERNSNGAMMNIIDGLPTYLTEMHITNLATDRTKVIR